ncbi:hypothetical protein [Rhizobium rhizogenes]|uniref:hypothetical protein n=1 Tax=Rhizobium rhizogenes TaxID=359 RepID=UPI0015731E4A|nr:hypothetical protein [Rhizobium rhizogenes]NTI41589.1 hypothetical protein [Rhizobium rhizogenes]
MKRSSAILQHRRAELEARIEEMIGLLDVLDGDPDLEDNGDDEPSLGQSACSANGKPEYDLEADTSDDEHTLGWRNPHIGQYEPPEGWSSFDGENGASTMPFYDNLRFDGDGHHIGRKLLRDHVKDRRKLAKALDATRVSPGIGRYV